MEAMADRPTVDVCAQDPISEAGVISHLRPRPEVTLASRDKDGKAPQAQVMVVVASAIDEEALQTLRNIHRGTRVVLVATEIDEQKLVSAAECGVAGVVRRTEATPDHLVRVIVAVANGEGHVPADLLGRLLEQVGKTPLRAPGPRGAYFTGLSSREIDVIRLLAEGYDTPYIAAKLAVSERTIKGVIHQVVTRLHLRNRTHIVAYALQNNLL
ncbi:response regulator transcription factor [Streptomyces sp. NPDC058280]|uniref:response regulator transcription factor n=1 Tax=Streptomyces sp. NPDC058280 TaxID=3346419 RepID=UPI0036F168FB